MYDLVIFDLDGTLIDSLGDLASACNKALMRHGFPVHPTEAYRYFVGNGLLKLAERSLPEDSRSDGYIRMIVDDFNEIYAKEYNVLTHPYDGVKELVQELKAHGILTAVASNKPDIFTKTIISEMFGDVFSSVKGKADGMPVKPDPAIIQSITDTLGITAERTVMVGDSAVDMHTANNAGIHSIGCTWGFRTLSELKEGGAEHIADTPADVLGIVLGS